MSEGGRRAFATRVASEQVAAHIQHVIQDEGLQPGDFLGRVDDLAERFGVSRPTLREALKLLAGNNLLRATKGPGGGVFVANTAQSGIGASLSESIGMLLETSAVTLEELLDARTMLEVPLAGRAAIQADGAMIERLHAALDRERAEVEHDGSAATRGSGGRERVAVSDAAASQARDLAALADADAEFHRAIAAAAGNRMAQALTEWVFDVLQPTLMAEISTVIVPSAIAEQHDALLRAIERGDPARAERAMRDHLRYLGDVLRLSRDSG